MIEAATRTGGYLAKQPLCVVDPEAQSLLAGLCLEKPLLTTVVQEDLPQAPEARDAAPGWRRQAARWREAFRSTKNHAQEPQGPLVTPPELATGPAVVDALANGIPIRFGWEVIDVAATEATATVRYVAPSGERTTLADGVIVSMPLGKPEQGGRHMTVFFESTGTDPSDGPIALHNVPDADSGATSVWMLQVEGHATTRIDLSDETSDQWWDLPDEEVGTSLWDLLPSALSLAGSRPSVHRFIVPGSPGRERPQEGPRIVHSDASSPGLVCALAAGLDAAERLI